MVLGYILGVFIHPRLVSYRMQHKDFLLSESSVLTDTLFDIQTGGKFRLADTLAYRSRNLLVFWSPTCNFSKQFFLNQLNNQTVGIYCFPLTDDWEYVEYYVDNHQIPYPQIGQSVDAEIKSLVFPNITAVPTFIIVDSLGGHIADFIGINNMDEIMNTLYQ